MNTKSWTNLKLKNSTTNISTVDLSYFVDEKVDWIHFIALTNCLALVVPKFLLTFEK